MTSRRINELTEKLGLLYKNGYDSISLGNIFLEYLNLSIIEGEYIFNDFSKSLNNLNREIYQLLSNSSSDSIEEGESNPDVNIFQVSCECVSLLDKFKKSIEGKYVKPEITLSVSIKSEENPFRKYKLPDYLLQGFEDFLVLNIGLARIDHNFSDKDSILQVLLSIHTSLNERLKHGTSKYLLEIYQILYDKCCFLIIKIIKQRTKKQYYQSGTDNILLTETEFSNINRKYLNKISLQSDKDIDIGTVLEREYNGTSLTFDDYYKLARHYRQQKVIGCLEELIIKFNNQYLEGDADKNYFDKRSARVTLNYFKNNAFALFLESNPKLEQIQRKIEEIKDLQIKTQVKNYFPYLKVCYHLEEIIKNESLKNDPNTSLIDSCIQLWGKYSNNLRENLEWSNSTNFIPFQYEIADCKINEGSSDNYIFIASYNVPPINYEVVKAKFEELNYSLLSFKTSNAIEKKLEQEKGEIQRIQEDLKKTDRKHVEILSVFAAIVLFVSGNIQLFTKLDTMKQAIVFMLTFALVLFLFVYLIREITNRHNDRIARNIPWGLIIFLIIFLLWLFWGKDSNLSKSPPNEKENTSIIQLNK